MKLGDLVEWSGSRWLVHKLERATKSAILVNVEGVKEVVAQTLDEGEAPEAIVITNPSTDWPFLTLPSSRKLGRLTSVTRPIPMGEPLVLTPFVDWVRLDAFQIGGPLFLNPALRLGLGHVVVAVFERGTCTLRIPRGFGTSSERVARTVVPEEALGPRSSYERLLEGDFDDDEE